jgi:hypothetical protein
MRWARRREGEGVGLEAEEGGRAGDKDEGARQ